MFFWTSRFVLCIYQVKAWHFLFHHVRAKIKSNLFGKASPSLENRTLYIYLFYVVICLSLHNFYCIFPLWFIPPILTHTSTSPYPPNNRHTVVHVHELFLFLLLLHPSLPLNPHPLSCQPALYLCRQNKDRFTDRRHFS